ncbi:unnamed protein product [Amoebophrya sp. A25]|nr:unnamed protein product [Amoebophrya sp. A25]|eukprot:GSA25T00006541001.1
MDGAGVIVGCSPSSSSTTHHRKVFCQRRLLVGSCLEDEPSPCLDLAGKMWDVEETAEILGGNYEDSDRSIGAVQDEDDDRRITTADGDGGGGFRSTASARRMNTSNKSRTRKMCDGDDIRRRRWRRRRRPPGALFCASLLYQGSTVLAQSTSGGNNIGASTSGGSSSRLASGSGAEKDLFDSAKKLRGTTASGVDSSYDSTGSLKMEAGSAASASAAAAASDSSATSSGDPSSSSLAIRTAHSSGASTSEHSTDGVADPGPILNIDSGQNLWAGRQGRKLTEDNNGGVGEKLASIVDSVSSAARRFLYILNAQLERTTGQSPVSAGPDRGFVSNPWFNTKTSDETSALLPAVYPTTTQSLKVKQGLSYSEVRLRSQGSTGEDGYATTGNFTIKLIPQNGDCEKSTPSVMGAPFNGIVNQHDATVGITRGTVVYTKVIFPIAGFFQLCYTRDEVSYEVLAPLIEVEGSDKNDNKWFCSLSLMHAARIGCQNLPYDDGCQCQGLMTGWQQTGTTLVRLGNDTTSGFDGSQFKLALQNYEGSGSTVYYCGDGDSGHGLQEPFGTRIADVLETSTKRVVYNFRKLKTTQNQPYVFRMCYCLNFDWDTGDANPACQQDQQQTFATDVGTLVIIQTRVYHNGAEVGAFPTLKWQLVLDCGCRKGTTCDQGGGCSESAEKAYKIVKQSALNNKPYFDDTSGCRFAEQIAAEVQVDVNREEGGQYSPLNCLGSADCRHEPDSATEIKTPTWSNVQISASYHNEQMLTRLYDVCYCDFECKVASNWFKAGVLQMRPLEAAVYSPGELSLITPPVINTDFSIVIRTPKDIPIVQAETGLSDIKIGSFSSMSSGEATREMKILEDPLALTTPQHCLRYAQSSLVSGHAQVNPNSNIDYAQPAGEIDTIGNIVANAPGLGFKYGFANGISTIKIAEPGFYAICYCDQMCNAEHNWLVVHRQIVSGPEPNQKWTRVTGVTFNLRLKGHLFQTKNRILALEATKELADCGTSAPTSRFFGPKVLAPQLSSNLAVMDIPVSGPSIARGLVRDPSGRGSVMEFSALHGLKDDDQIYLEVQWNEPMLLGMGKSQIQIEELRKMYTNVHSVSVLCDYEQYVEPGSTVIVPACHRILIPVKFSASDFPYQTPVTVGKTNEAITAMTWTRSSEEEFILMKVSSPSPDSRGYVICWAQSDNSYNTVGMNVPTFTQYKAAVGFLIVKDPVKMSNSWLSLTTIENSVYGGSSPTERISPVIVTFETGSSARYTSATGEMGVKLTFENKETLNAITSRQEWAPVLIPYDQSTTQRPAADASGNSSPAQIARTSTRTLKDIIPVANQKMCGDLFVELWGEHENGFPQPKKCFAYYDDVSHTLGTIDPNPVVELYVFFHAKNGFAPNTQYQMVLHATFNEQLTKDQPAQGAVKVYALDEDFGSTFEVIESGDCKPEPQDVIPPANAADRWNANDYPALKYTGTGPLGFQLLDTDGTADGYMAITRYCIRTDATAATPSATYSCQPCQREEDCGNGRVATPTAAAVDPDEDRNWCQTPIQKDCFEDQQNLSEYPLFKFMLLPENDAKPISSGNILKIFLHPLTQWDIGGNNCDMFYEPAGGGALQEIVGCDKGSVTFRTGTMTDNPEQQVNYIRMTIPVGMTITSASQPVFHLGGALPVPKFGYFPTHFSAEFTKEKDKGGRYLSQRDLERITVQNNAKNFVRPWSAVARILTRIGPTNGNQSPFSTQTNLLYMQLVFGTVLYAEKNERIAVRLVAPQLQAEEGSYKCQKALGGLPVPGDLEYFQNVGTPTGRGTFGSQPMDNGNEVGIDVTIEGTWGAPNTNPYCEIKFREHLMMNAGTSIVVPFKVINPEPLKIANEKNYWQLKIYYTQTGVPQVNIEDGFAIPKKFSPRRMSAIKDAPITQGVQYGRILDDVDFSKNTAVLGKLEMNVIQPEFFAQSFLMNELSVFFKTKQRVGTQATPFAQIWVDAPKEFDFSQYCLVSDLPAIYYVPEPAEPTNMLPRAAPDDEITCLGATVPGSGTSAGTYNRARLSIDGRLLVGTIYGFRLRVKNAGVWEMTQRDSWGISTYENAGTEKIDATQFSPRLNQEDPGRPDSNPNDATQDAWTYDQGEPNLSFQTFLTDLPSVQNAVDQLYYSTHFIVGLGDMRPNAAGLPTDILIFPVQLDFATPTAIHVRLVAPHGYQWLFTPAEFLYESINSGVPESQAVPGAELDFPLSLVPPMPIVKPLNELRMDSMRTGFVAGKKYGIKTKIKVPNFTMVDSLNRFTIEFGYDELDPAKRFAAGSYPAPIVRKLLNANVNYETSLRGAVNKIFFSLQTITDIQRGGGLVITGPSGFIFAAACLPVAVDPPPGIRNPPNTDLPFDATCTSFNDGTTQVPTITITAGPQGIAAKQYAFMLQGTNPGTTVTDADAGTWEIASFELASVKTDESILDFRTSVPSFGITNPMPMADLVSKPWRQCGEDYSLCLAPEQWQYQAPRGLRNDRPKRSTHVIIKFMMTCNTDDAEDAVGDPSCRRIPDGDPNILDMKVNAPEGYLFDLNCEVVTQSHLVLWANNPTLTMPSGFSVCCGEADVKNWPTAPSAEVLSCKGNGNKALIQMRRGLKGKSVYLFRIAVQSTPSENPSYNMWSLEFNGETSTRFNGYNIWSFTEYSIVPRDSSIIGRSGAVVENEVTISLKLRNLLAVRGYFRIVAPTGFEIRTTCDVKVTVSQKEVQRFCDYEGALSTADVIRLSGSSVRWCPVPDTLNQKGRWTNYEPLNAAGTIAPSVECRGDEKPSNNVRLRLMHDKVMLDGVLYSIALMVKNPLAVQQEAQDWLVRTFRPTSEPGDEVQREIDRTTIPGFPVNFQVITFSLGIPADRNAGYEVVFVFQMSFPQDVVTGESVVILAPAGYLMARTGTKSCTDYVHLLGFLARTTPRCGGNMISWTLVDDRAPAADLISFSLKTINPGMTPSPNYFSIRVMETESERMIASKVFEGYPVIPALLGLKVENIPPLPNTPSETKNQHSCRGHIKDAYALIVLQESCRATESLITLKLSFTTRSAANLLRITGWVFSGIPQVSSTQMQGVPKYEQIAIPTNRLQVESYRSPPGLAEGSNRIKFSEVDPVLYPSVQFNNSEILLIPLKTPTTLDNGLPGTPIDGIQPDTSRVINIPRVSLPPFAGVILWDIATFSVPDSATTQLPWYVDDGDTDDYKKKDEVKQFHAPSTEPGYSVLPYIELTTASTLIPGQFGQLNARVMLNIILNAPVYQDEVLFITRPTGYRFVPDSFMPASPNLQYTQEELAQGLTYVHGVDTIYSQPTDIAIPPTRYYFQLVRFIQANSALIVEFNVDVPTQPYKDTHWFVEIYLIKPVVDADGFILKAETGAYPWDDIMPGENRLPGDDPARWQRRMTNDGSFQGFFLVGDMGQITLNPSLRTPGAQIDLEIKFSIASKVEAPNQLDKLRLEVLAPPNYRFTASCLVSQGEVTRFTKCNGNNNKAVLETSSNSIQGVNIPVVLQVANPPIHSDDTAVNTWSLQLFRGAETQPSNVGTAAGYKIQSMTASYIGNNRVGGASSAFFKFKPNQMMPKGGSLQIQGPTLGGYDLRCNGVHQGSLPEIPRCQASGVDQPLLLELKESALQANVEYVFGIGVVNPSTVNTGVGFQNKWGLVLVTRDGRTVDANMSIDGVELVSIDLEFDVFAWSKVEPQEMATLVMELVAVNPLQVGEIEWLSIESPEGIMFNDPAGFSAAGLPLIAQKPFRIAGNQLIIELTPESEIQEGVISVQFDVKNPSRVPTDNKWVIRGMKGLNEKFLDVVPGYLFGQTSPKLVAASKGGDAGSPAERRIAAPLVLGYLLSIALSAVVTTCAVRGGRRGGIRGGGVF